MRTTGSGSAGSGAFRPGLILVALLLATLVAGIPGGAVRAQTPEIDQKRAEAEQVQARIGQTLQDLAKAHAAYDESVRKLEEIKAGIRAKEQDIKATERELENARDQLSDRAANSYKTGGVMYLDVLLSVRSFRDLASKGRVLVEVMGRDRAVIQKTREIKGRLEDQQAALKDRRAEQARVSRDLAAQQAAMDRRLQEQRNYYASLDAEIKQLVREEQERRAREAAKRRAELAAQAAAEARAQEVAEAERAQRRAAMAEVARQQAEQGQEQRAPEPPAPEPPAPAPEPQPAAQDQYEEETAAQEQYEAPETSAPDTPAEETVTAADPRAQAILDNPNIEMYPGVEQDIASGAVDPRILDVIEFAAQNNSITLSAITTGHPYGTSPTLDALGYPGYPNAHYFGRAVDIAVVDGSPVSSGNAAAQALAQAIYDTFSPQELGSPWTFGPGSFSDAIHQNHIHVGWAYASDGGL